jgi:3-deoxy-D-arabino-heptulosonate 7-phosphate (DAHP) synthase
MKKGNVNNPSLIIDTSHDNCRDEKGIKHPEKQIEIMEYVMKLEKEGKIPPNFIK